LRDLGYNSFVFDYTGFGSSEGVPSVETLDDNAKDAWSKFCELSNETSSRIAFGHSLGSAVLLGSVNTYSSAPNNLIIHAPFSSAREIAVHLGTADRSWAWILPDMWNNTENIQDLPTTKICIVHSKSDEITPYRMSLKISELMQTKPISNSRSGMLLIIAKPLAKPQKLLLQNKKSNGYKHYNLCPF